MKTFQKKDLTPLLAGVAFLLMAAIKLTHLISGFSFSFILLFSCIACVALSALIFMKKRNVLIGIIIATFVAPAIFYNYTISAGLFLEVSIMYYP